MKRRHIAAAAVLLAGCGPKPTAFREAALELPAEEVAAIREGVPQVPRDIMRSIPMAENAAYEYERMLQDPPKFDEDWQQRTDAPVTTPHTGVLYQATYVIPSVGAIEAAVQKPHCAFNHDYSLGLSMPYPEMDLVPTLKAYQYSVSRARLLDAVSAFKVICKVQGHVLEEPCYVPFTAAATIGSHLRVSVEKALNSGSYSAYELDWHSVEGYFPAIPAYEYPLRGQAVLLQMQTHRSTPSLPPSLTNSNNRNEMQEAFGARGLQMYRKAFQIARDPKLADQQKDASLKQLNTQELAGDDTHALNKLMLVPSDIGEQRLRMMADRSLIVEGMKLAVAHERGQSATYAPTSKDPFDAESTLSKKVSLDEIVIYSKGPNGRDDKGVGDDISMKVELKPGR